MQIIHFFEALNYSKALRTEETTETTEIKETIETIATKETTETKESKDCYYENSWKVYNNNNDTVPYTNLILGKTFL